MSNHLSQDRMSMWILGQSTPEEQQHGRECSFCRAELARFQEPVGTFQSAMRDWSDQQAVPQLSAALLSTRRQGGLSYSSWAWSVVGVAAVILTAIPIYREGNELRRRARAQDAALVMDAVNLHLSRTVPAPMEPILALIPNDETATESGGIQ